MATRSTIAMVTPEGTIKAIYCHWDGYLEHNGQLLLDHYNDQATVEKLISLGDVSSLGSKIDPTGGSGHSFNTPEDAVTVFYGRDRGEDSVFAGMFNDTNEWLQDAGQEFNYLFDNGTWKVQYSGGMVDLAEQIS